MAKVGATGAAPPVVAAASAAAPKKGEPDKATKAAKKGIDGATPAAQSTAADLIELLSEPLEQRAAPDSPPSPTTVRLVKKVADFNLGTPDKTINWKSKRVVSPEGLCAYRSQDGVRFISFDEGSGLRLFNSKGESQGLVMHDGQVVAASVTAGIKSETARKKEAKGTAVQYDKTRVKAGDFAFCPTNYRGWVNYQGGHLIDHKFSAEGSHYHEPNYIPMHFFYNAPLKEYLVQHGDAYVEIPLYTPNPPQIGVKGELNKFHPIPVGIIFIQILKNKVQAIYFFPNNNFDYKALKDKLGLKKDLAATIAPYFKLDPVFYPLLRAAMINDLGQEKGKDKQAKREARFFGLTDEISEGMAWAECPDDAGLTSRLSFQVLHGKSVDASLCLDCSEAQFAKLDGPSLVPAFNALGQFLVRYCLRNALKSEVCSVWSRLVFLNVIIDFIEGYSQVKKAALEFVDTLAKEFRQALTELEEIMPTMTQKELFYLANTYQRLSEEFNHAFSYMGYEIYDDDDFETYFRKFVVVIKYIASRYSVKDLSGDDAWNFLTFVQEAQRTLDYFLEAGFEREMFETEGAALKALRGDCLSLLAKVQGKAQGVSVEFQTNVKRAMATRTSTGFIESFLRRLGFSDDESSDSDADDVNVKAKGGGNDADDEASGSGSEGDS